MILPDKGVSVVVCCYNSQNRLPDTLKYLANQAFERHISWEIVIVDNASTDDTFNVSLDLLNKLLPEKNFKVVSEPKPGLNHARKKGLELSQYEYVIFCDDDNWLSAEYLYKVFDLFEKHADIGIVSGRTTGVYEIEPPDWFQTIQVSYAVGKQAPQSTILNAVWGAGMGIRKSAYKELFAKGFKHMNLDRFQDKLYSGGDTELCYAFGLMGYKIWYEDSLHLWHFIPIQRLNFEYAKQLFYYIGYASPTILVYGNHSENKRNKPFNWFKAFVKSVLWMIYTSILPSKSLSHKTGYPNALLVEVEKGRAVKLWQWKGSYKHLRQQVIDAEWNKKGSRISNNYHPVINFVDLE
ncbi:glycosyltransferase [Flavihumibacter sp.]|uniref:glycosyltransferase n=1 Tax=Flavihumibacter sp. TaxID=1913981 RepID=UPI002FCC7C36